MRLLEETAFSLEEGSAMVSVGRSESGCQTHTDRFRSSLIALISIFRRPMLTFGGHETFEAVDWTDFGRVVTRGQLRPVSKVWWENEDKETKPALGSETLWEEAMLKENLVSVNTPGLAMATVYLSCMHES